MFPNFVTLFFLIAVAVLFGWLTRRVWRSTNPFA
jgi:flagellar biogenesis protein FliO